MTTPASFQYLHTSAKRGLEPGKSGFCCVARDRDLPPDLIQELEQQSRYHAFDKELAPTILRHRIATLRSGAYHILTRIQDAGADYSKRNNHIAHHIAFPASAIAGLPNPASILLHWSRWRATWDEPPRILGASDAFAIQDVESRWTLSDTQARLPRLVEGGDVLRRVVELDPGEENWLIDHIRATLNDPRVDDQWSYPFTNLLLPTDAPGDYVWSGAWRGRPLPYEIDFKPRPLQPPAPAPTVADAAASADFPPEDSGPLAFERNKPPATAAKKYGPTIVEIPQELDRSRRRRPRRRFGRRELARAVNLSVAALALASLGTLAYWYWRNQEQVGTLIEEKVDASKPSPIAAATARYEARWRSFVEAGYPSRFIDDADRAASFFASQGNDEPAEIMAFVKRLRRPAPIPFNQPAPVPAPLLSYDSGAVSLALEAAEHPRINGLALAPAAVANAVADLAESAPQRLFARLPAARYETAATLAAVQEFIAEQQQLLSPQNPDASAALSRFLELKRAALENPQFQPLLTIEAAFGLPPAAGYLAFGANGRLLTAAQPDYAAFLVELFSTHVVAHFAALPDREPFRSAFDQLRTQAFVSGQDAAKAIHNAMLLARPQTDTQTRAWRALEEAWGKTFIRPDLMQETIIAYTIEALETARAELLAEQARFGVDDLANHRRQQELARAAESALRKIETTGADATEWVVFETQTSQ